MEKFQISRIFRAYEKRSFSGASVMVQHYMNILKIFQKAVLVHKFMIFCVWLTNENKLVLFLVVNTVYKPKPSAHRIRAWVESKLNPESLTISIEAAIGGVL